MWAGDGTWEPVFTALVAQAGADEDLDRAVSVDSTTARAHQHAAGAVKRAPAGEPGDHAIGRSRSGLTTKIHLAADARCRPSRSSQPPDRPVTRLPSPRSWPACGCAVAEDAPAPGRKWSSHDKAHSSRVIREHLRKCGIRAVIPVPADQRRHRLRPGSRGSRPPAFDRETYKQRNTVERCINRLKRWRGIATRYEKTTTIYLAGLHIAGNSLWPAR